MHWHDLRPEGCRLLADGVDIRLIQLILGHSDSKTTQRYLNITDEEMRNVLTEPNDRSKRAYLVGRKMMERRALELRCMRIATQASFSTRRFDVMMSATIALALMLAAEGAPLQQPTFTPSTNPVSDAARAHLAREPKHLIAAAELLPADKYSYRPTPAQMTFGDLIAHIVQTNLFLCAATSATPAPMSPPEVKKIAGTDGKDALVAAMKKSFDYCSEGFAKLQDSALAEEASLFGQKTGMSRGAALVTILVDWADHYSTAASYLRLNGVLPPSAVPKK